MSNINTNGINVNYPVPGVNNNSQGFRDNFASIATNLNSAATEITDLQNKVVVKQALTGTTINNDMANTLISNASTRSFRATTYNLGNALVGTVLVDVSLADVHYGTVAGNTTVNFGSWAPSGTQSNVQVNLSISNNLSTITFSGNIVLANANTNGASTLENFANVGGLVTVTVPNGVSQLNYLVSTTDCGNTLYISPINRPRVATAIQNRSPIPTGFQGDVLGDVAADADYMYVCTGSYDASIVTKTLVVQTYASGNKINCTSTSGLFANAPIIFSGTGFGNIVPGATYYIKTIPDGANITISQDGFSGIVGNAVALTNATGTMSANSYNGTSIWQSINLAVATGTDTTTGNLTVTNNANIGNNLTVVGNTTSGNFIGTFANGTSNINIPTANGDINVVVAGTQRLVLTSVGANITGTANVSGVLTTGGNISTFGTNGVVQANNITVTGAASGSANVASLVGSLGIRAITSTYTDSTASASSTVVGGAVHAIGAPVLAASNASVTFTNASTLYIGGSPSAGTNTTITNPYSLYVGSGNSYFNGKINISGQYTTTVTTGTAPFVVTSTTQVANLNVASAGLATYATTANAVAGANVSGAVGLATYATTANAVAGANVSGQVANALVAGTIYTNAQPNITSTGTLTGLTVTGNSGVATPVTINDTSPIAGSTKAFVVGGGSQQLAVIANITNGSYNSLQTTGDIALVATGAIQGNVGFSIVPWASAASGIRISSVSNVATITLGAANTNTTGALTTSGNISTSGTNGVVQANNITVTGAASGNANISTVTGSMGLRAIASTYTDSVAAASSTVDVGAVHAIGVPVLAASNASVTFTNASTLYITGAPSAGANVTITNPYALIISSGNSYFGGTGNFTGNVTIASSGSKSLTIIAQTAGTAQIKLTSSSTGGPDSYITSTLATGGLHLQTNSTTGLFINSSQNVGIGNTSPASKLHVFTTSAAGNAANQGVNISNADNTRQLLLGVDDAASTTWIQGWIPTVGSSNLVLQPTEGYVGIGASTSTQLRSQLTVSGPGQLTADLTDAGATTGTIQINSSVNAVGRGGALTFGALIDNNSYTPFAAIKGLLTNGLGNGTGDLAFSTRNVTGDTALTERMRITSGGDFVVGTTTSAGKVTFAATGGTQNTLTVKNSTVNFYTIASHNEATSGDNWFIVFGTEASFTARGSITYNRAGGLTAYNTGSDYRAKDIYGPVVDSGALIDSVPVYRGKMKGATQERPMFIAHETPAYAHTGEKDAVDADGNPVYQQMDASALIPVMWAEIQSLRKRLAALEAK